MATLPSRRRLRRRERARRRRFVIGAVITLVLIGGSLVRLSRLPTPPAEAHTAPDRSSELLALRTEPVDDATDTGDQPAYPYSIIPGGARNADALRTAIDADPVVRVHYANFDLAKVHIVRLTEPRLVHVSYRLGDQVFWTRRPVLLKANETLLTDGVHYARTRCANRLAVTPGPISATEPAVGVLDTPIPVPRSSRVFPSVPVRIAEDADSTAGSGVHGTPFSSGGIPIGSPPLGPALRTVLTELRPRPQLFGSSVGLLLPPSEIRDSDDFPHPNAYGFDNDPPDATRDDPHTSQVPEPGVTLLTLGGGALWAGRQRRSNVSSGSSDG